MSEIWYYVQNDQSVGPVTEEKMQSLFRDGTLTASSYVWRKEFKDWQKASDVEFFQSVLSGKDKKDFWDVGEKNQVITIKVGYDRGEEEREYGPYSLEQMRRAFQEKRINEKTFIFVPGMENWTFLAETPLFAKISNEMPPKINEGERRISKRRPFVARLLFHNESTVFEGVCRDISAEGLQILVTGFNADIGDIIKLNIHPDNSELCFSTSAKIVRILEGRQGLAVKFENLDKKAQTLIQKYVNNP